MSGCTENKLSEIEKNEIAIRTKAMSEEEITAFLENIPSSLIWKEMKRRDEIKDQILRDMESALKGVK